MRPAILLFFCGLAACGPAPGHPLPGEWRIVMVDGAPVVAESRPAIRFRRAVGPGRVSYAVDTGCNGGEGTLVLRGKTLRPGRSGAYHTVGCPEALTVQEERVRSALTNVQSWTALPGGRIGLLRPGGGMVLARGAWPPRPAPAPVEASVNAAGLIGRWSVVSKTGSSLGPDPVRLTIDTDQIHFQAACVGRSWSYSAKDGAISARPLPWSSCDLGLGPVVESVWDVLDGARSYSVLGGGAALITAGDGRRLHLRRAPSG